MGSCNSVDAESNNVRRNTSCDTSLKTLSKMVNDKNNRNGRTVEEYSYSSDNRIKSDVKSPNTIKARTYRDIVNHIRDSTEALNNRACSRPIILKQDGSQVKLQKISTETSSSSDYYYYSDSTETSEHSSDYIYLKSKEERAQEMESERVL